MRQNKKKIYNHLYACQQRFGGYTGKDIEEIARYLGFYRKTVKRYVEQWSKTDPLFAELNILREVSCYVRASNPMVQIAR